ncbi:MAG: hypothetical protein RR417_04220 [Kiritimatiellia bacterium]
MNIVLRILVIVTLLLNGVALWFATSLYGKRNLLIDRNEAFDNFTATLAQTFEAEEAKHENTAAGHEARDISPVTLATADITPDKSDFWESYKQELEKIDGKNYSIADKRSDLAEVYILNAEGKPERDARGAPVKDGAPMALLLAEIQKKAMEQRSRLNTVRGELTKVRTELEDAIVELNGVKKDARQSLKTIQAKEEQIAALEADKARLESEKAALEEEKATLENEKAALQADYDKIEEELESAKAEIEKLKATIEKIVVQGTGGKSDSAAAVANVSAGVKGKITRVNNEYNYCLVEVDDTVLAELIGEDGSRPLPELELLVRRPGADQGVLGKIRLRTITKDIKTIVCDILSGWKQGEIQKGDEAFYLD